MPVRSPFVTKGSDTEIWPFLALIVSTIAHLLDISADEGRGKSRWEQGLEIREAEVEFHSPASPGRPVPAWTLEQGRNDAKS